MKPPSEVKAELVRQWIAKSEEDYLVAEHLLEVGTFSLSAVGFHAQQAAEKLLKAYLVHHQVNFPKTHDIDRLPELVSAVDESIGERIADISMLTAFSVEARYPGDYPDVTPDEAIRAVASAARVRDVIRARLSKD